MVQTIIKIAVTSLSLVLSCMFCQAQLQDSTSLHFNKLTVENGMPENTVNAWLQDKYGYVWIGTYNGLVKYDGYTTKVYKIGAQNGVSGNINTLWEDGNGNVWIGTENEGLYCYDRFNDTLVHYPINLKDSGFKAYHSIRDITTDNKGNLWVMYSNPYKNFSYMVQLGIQSKKGTAPAVKLKTKFFIDSYVPNINIDNEGNLIVATSNGLIEYDAAKKKFVRLLNEKDSSQQKFIFTAYCNKYKKGEVWFVAINNKSHFAKTGIYNTITKSIYYFNHNASDPLSIYTDSSYCFYSDHAGRIWIGNGYGLSLYNAAKNNFINYKIPANEGRKDANLLQEIHEDKSGNFWCKVDSGLLFFNTKTFTYRRYAASDAITDGLYENYVSLIRTDNAGTPWLGIGQEACQWLNKGRSKFTVYKSSVTGKGYNGGMVFTLTETPEQNFWMGCANGLYYWQPRLDSFAKINLTKYNLQNFEIQSILLDSKGLVWFGCFFSKPGLYCYNPATKTLKNYLSKKNDSLTLNSNHVQAICEDTAGIIWIGTYDAGVCSYNRLTGKFTRYPFNSREIVKVHDMLDDEHVDVMFVDRNNNVWAVTDRGGLNKFDRKQNTFIPYSRKTPGLTSGTQIIQDRKGILWTGTYTNGLYALDESSNTFKKYDSKNGLLYDGCWGIQDDNKGNIWVASPRGISVLNAETGKVRTITADNGLPESPTWVYLYKASSGMFFMGYKNGFVTFNPADFTPDTIVPVMHIETVKFVRQSKQQNQETDSTLLRFGRDKINLAYNENRITFSYVGLLYQNAAAVKYAYKLDGYDKAWMQAGTQRTTTYTNLSPGTYTFHVKAANSDGVWTTKEDTVTIIISPPWWQTWWAYLLYAIVFIAALSLFIAYRSQTLKNQNKILEEKVVTRTSQLNQKTEELNKSFEELKSTQAQLIQSEKMASLGELTAGIAHEIQNPLNFVNNFSEINNELIEELKAESLTMNAEQKELMNDIYANNEKIAMHGKRADAIVKGMLQHSRKNKGQKEPTDINKLCDEYLRLSYHGLRAKDKSFNADFKTDFDETIGKVNLVAQDISRVLLNLFNNAFYAVNEKSHPSSAVDFRPLVSVQTKKINDKVEIRISDNGNGILSNIIDKIFQPFFTTKPTGQGTGLGLSLAYDIITKEHSGTLKVDSEEYEGSTFIINLPIT